MVIATFVNHAGIVGKRIGMLNGKRIGMLNGMPNGMLSLRALCQKVVKRDANHLGRITGFDPIDFVVG